MKWIYSIANLKVSLNSNNIIQNLTSFLLCHYSTEVLKKKKIDLRVQFWEERVEGRIADGI